MTRNLGSLDRLVRGGIAVVALVLALVVGIGTVAGVILAIVAGVMAVTAAVSFCPLYRLLGFTSDRQAPAPR